MVHHSFLRRLNLEVAIRASVGWAISRHGSDKICRWGNKPLGKHSFGHSQSQDGSNNSRQSSTLHFQLHSNDTQAGLGPRLTAF
jgi:hypothetical protein